MSLNDTHEDTTKLYGNDEYGDNEYATTTILAIIAFCKCPVMNS